MNVNYLSIIFLLGTCASRTSDVTELCYGHPYRITSTNFPFRSHFSVLLVFLLKLCMHFSRLSCVLLLWGTVSVQVHATKAYRGSRGAAPLILNLGTRWRWAVNFTSRPIYARVRTGGWMGLRAGLGVLDKRKTACPCQESKPELSSPQPGQYDYTTPAPTFSKE